MIFLNDAEYLRDLFGWQFHVHGGFVTLWEGSKNDQNLKAKELGGQESILNDKFGVFTWFYSRLTKI